MLVFSQWRLLQVWQSGSDSAAIAAQFQTSTCTMYLLAECERVKLARALFYGKVARIAAVCGFRLCPK